MKKLLLPTLCGLLILALTACSGGDILDRLGGEGDSDALEYEAGAVKLENDTTYYNDYIGASLNIPVGWYVYDVSADNFATSEGTTSDTGTLDIYMGDGYRDMFLIDCATLQDSSKDNHMGFTVYAEQVDDIATLSEYMADYESLQTGHYEYTLLDEDSAQISGQFFEVRLFEVDNDGHNYYYLNFVCEASGGYFLVIEASYWPANTDAPGYIESYLQNNLIVQTPERPVV